MARLLTLGGDEVCVLTAFVTQGAIGPTGAAFTSHVSFDGAMLAGHNSSERFLVEHGGKRYNAIVQKTSSVQMDGRSTGTISGQVWPLDT